MAGKMAKKMKQTASFDDDGDYEEEYEGGAKSGKDSKKKQSEQGGFLSFFGLGKKDTGDMGKKDESYNNLSPEQQKERIKLLWSKARRYNNKLRFQARLQKMAESNLKEMMIDDINEDAEEEN